MRVGAPLPRSPVGKIALRTPALGILALGGLPVTLFIICLYIGAVSGDHLPRG